MFAIPLIMIINICNRARKELNDSFEKEKQLWEEYYETRAKNNGEEMRELLEQEKE